MSFVWNFDVDGGTDYVLNIWSPDPSNNGTYIDFSGATAELRIQTVNSLGVKATILDVTSGVTNANASIVLGSSALTVYDNTSTPQIVLTIPTHKYWTVHLFSVFTAMYAAQEIIYQFNVIDSSGIKLRPASGVFTLSYNIPVGS